VFPSQTLPVFLFLYDILFDFLSVLRRIFDVQLGEEFKSEQTQPRFLLDASHPTGFCCCDEVSVKNE